VHIKRCARAGRQVDAQWETRGRCCRDAGHRNPADGEARALEQGRARPGLGKAGGARQVGLAREKGVTSKWATTAHTDRAVAAQVGSTGPRCKENKRDF
jgi:hypothetical protein